MTDVPIDERHPGTQQAMRWLSDGSHLRDRQAQVFDVLCQAAHQVLRLVPDDPETTAGLRKLTEAKDCFVRASLTVEDPGDLGDLSSGLRFGSD